MVRYLPAPRLRQAGLTTNGKSDSYGISHPIALRYRRVNGTFYEFIDINTNAFIRLTLLKLPLTPPSPPKLGEREG
jgi:hypothetical protein